MERFEKPSQIFLRGGAVLFLILGISGVFAVSPELGKVGPDPQEMKVADLIGHGAGGNNFVWLEDFDYGSRPATESKSGSADYSKVYVALFPKGHADDSKAEPVILSVPNISNADQLKDFCRQHSDVLGLVREGEKADRARQAMAKIYPQMDTSHAPVVKFNDNFGLIMDGAFGALFLAAWFMILAKIQPMFIKKAQMLRQRREAAQTSSAFGSSAMQSSSGLLASSSLPGSAISSSDQSSPARPLFTLRPRTSGALFLIVGLLIALGFHALMVFWAEHNKEIFISYFLILIGPAIIATGLFQLIANRAPQTRLEKNILTAFSVLLGGGLYYLLCKQIGASPF